MVREYVGARYVPKFYVNSVNPASSEWESNVIYDPLTVVTLPNLHSYISKKLVPATVGSPVDNIEYWLDNGSDNAYVHQLELKVNDIITELAEEFNSSTNYNKGDLVIYDEELYVFINNHTGAWNTADVEPTNIGKNIKDNLANIRDEIDEAVTGLQEDIGNVETEVSNIDSRVDSLERNILILGNSYVNQGLCNILEESFKNHYHFTRSGVGFMPNAGHDYDFGDVLDDAIADTTYDKSSITDILIVSAVGDSRSYTEHGDADYRTYLASILAEMETKIATNYPNAKKVNVVLGESRGGLGFNTLQNFISIFKVHSIFNDILSNYKFGYIGWAGFNIMFKSGMMDADEVHLSTLGYKCAGTWLNRAYFGNANYQPYTALGTSATCKIRYTNNATVNAIFNVLPDRVRLNFSSVYVSAGDSVTIQNGGLWFSALDTDKRVPCPAYDETLYSDYVDPYTGTSIEKCRLQLTSDANGVMKILYYGTPAHSTVPSGVNNMATPTLYNAEYFL